MPERLRNIGTVVGLYPSAGLAETKVRNVRVASKGNGSPPPAGKPATHPETGTRERDVAPKGATHKKKRQGTLRQAQGKQRPCPTRL